MLMGSVTKNSSMKERKEEHNKLLNISYDCEVRIVCNEIQNLFYWKPCFVYILNSEGVVLMKTSNLNNRADDFLD